MGGRQLDLLVQARSFFVSDTATDMSPLSRDIHLLLGLAGWPYPTAPTWHALACFQTGPQVICGERRVLGPGGVLNRVGAL